MSKAIRKGIKLLNSYGYDVEVKQVKHGSRHYNKFGQFIQIASSPRTEAFINDIRQNIARHLGVSKATIS